ADMVPEIAAAVGFVSGLLRTRGCVSEQQLQVFSGALREALTGELRASTDAATRARSWLDSSGGSRGQASAGVRPDAAAGRVGLSLPRLRRLLPRELTLWVDPFEVSYRIGEDGSICVLYEAAGSSPHHPPHPHPHPHRGTSYGGMLTCKNQMMLGRASPSKNYVMTVSS
ncbi:BTG2 protein, partial [Dicaeum eximium]|nr:BTG2 protein [Dicaeum eximium]